MCDNKITSRPELGSKPKMKLAFSENLLPIQSFELVNLGGACPSAATSLRLLLSSCSIKRGFAMSPLKEVSPNQIISQFCTAPKCGKDQTVLSAPLANAFLCLCFSQCWCLQFLQALGRECHGSTKSHTKHKFLILPM